MLEIMLPNLVQAHVPVHAPVQAPVAVPVVVNVPLVAAGVQQLVGQIVAMEVEGDNETLKRLFLQKFGRELLEVEVDVDDINKAMDLIDLTKEDEMEVATSEVVQVVVKTEPIETPEAPIDDRRRSSCLERRGLRKNDVITDKEAPEVIADNDTDMAEDVSANPVGPVNAVESDNNMTYEEAMAAIDAVIADN